MSGGGPDNGRTGVGSAMARGAAWMMGMRLAARLVGLVSTLILARLLTPADFGLVAMAFIFLAALDALTEFGFDLALIRNRQADRRDYDTVWTLGLIRGLLAALAMAVLAVPAGALTGDARVGPVLLALAALPVMDGLMNVGVVDFRRDMRFDREFRFRMVDRLTTFAVTIPVAILWPSHWALVAGALAGRLGGLAASFAMSPFRPRLDLGRWRQILGFSKWVVAYSAVHFLNQRLDDLVVGRLQGAAGLGLYAMGKDIGSLATNELLAPISRVLFPGYARMLDDRPALTRSYLDVLGMVLLCGLPVAAGIALTADLIVALALPPEWAGASPVVMVFALCGAVQMVGSNAHPVLLALGRPNLTFRYNLAAAVPFVPLVLVAGWQWGGEGAAWAVFGRFALQTTLTCAAVGRILRPPAAAWVAVAWRPVAATALMVVVVLALRAGLPDGAPVWLAASASVAAGVGAYLVAVAVLWVLAGAPPSAERAVLRALATRLSDVRFRRVRAATEDASA